RMCGFRGMRPPGRLPGVLRGLVLRRATDARPAAEVDDLAHARRDVVRGRFAADAHLETGRRLGHGRESEAAGGPLEAMGEHAELREIGCRVSPLDVRRARGE